MLGLAKLAEVDISFPQLRSSTGLVNVMNSSDSATGGVAAAGSPMDGLDRVLHEISTLELGDFHGTARQLRGQTVFGHELSSAAERTAALIAFLQRIRVEDYPIGEYESRPRPTRAVGRFDRLRSWVGVTPLLASLPYLRKTFRPSRQFASWYAEEVMEKELGGMVQRFELRRFKLSGNILRLIHHTAEFAGIDEKRLADVPRVLLLVTMLYAVGSIADDLLDEDLEPSLENFAPERALNESEQRELLVGILEQLGLRIYSLAEELGGKKFLEYASTFAYGFIEGSYLRGKELLLEQGRMTSGELLRMHEKSNGIYWCTPMLILAESVGVGESLIEALKGYFLAISVASQIGDDIRDFVGDLDVSPNIVLATAAEVGEFEELAWAIGAGRVPETYIDRHLWLIKNFPRVMKIVHGHYYRVIASANDARKARGLRELPRDVFLWSKLLQKQFKQESKAS